MLPALTCPYEMDAMAPAVYRPTPGSSFCRASAVLGIWPASSDTTWQGRGRAQGSSWSACVQATHFAHGKMDPSLCSPSLHQPTATEGFFALSPDSSTFLAASCRRFPLE